VGLLAVNHEQAVAVLVLLVLPQHLVVLAMVVLALLLRLVAQLQLTQAAAVAE
jgi:hypothetical protein